METLKNYGVQKMNMKEMKEVDGGLPIIFFLIGVVIGALIYEAIFPEFE